MGDHWTIVFYLIIIISIILNIFLKVLHISQKNTPKLVAKILATNFGFEPDW